MNEEPLNSPAVLKKFIAILSEDTIDLKKLMRLSWHGIPSSVRHQVWPYLLHYYPVETSNKEAILEKKRQEYQGLKRALSFDFTEVELKTKKQIHLDIVRSTTDVPFLFHDKGQGIMENVLFIWSLRHPASGYVQGINDLVVPLFVVLMQQYSPLLSKEVFDDVTEQEVKNVEADLYFCLSSLLENVQDHYTQNQTKIFEQLKYMKQLVTKVDQKLSKHLENNNVEFFQFAFRWFNCFLLRELSLDQGLRLWDTYLSDEDGTGFSEFHMYVCVEIIEKYSERICSSEFGDIVQLLQHLPTDEWDENDMNTILSEAFILERRFRDAMAHLRGVN